MRYTLFGRTGLRVSELALGTGTFGTAWGWGSEREEARAVFDGFADVGGTFLDCSDVYQFGQAEEMLGEFVAADREHFVLATKYAVRSQRRRLAHGQQPQEHGPLRGEQPATVKRLTAGTLIGTGVPLTTN